MTWFYQEGPELHNQYDDDLVLQRFLNHFLPPEILEAVEEDLRAMGESTVNSILQLGLQAEIEEPELIMFDVWGRRVDTLQLSGAWWELKNISAEEGLVATGYEREYKEYSRLYQFAKIYLFTPSSAIFTCPLAMTDGAARIMEVYADDTLREKYLGHYTSRDPDEFYTSGQWMTERTGGSDLGRTETIARLEDGTWRLYGPKWFTSAIDADTAMTLARIEREGRTQEGSRGLSLFVLDIYREDGSPNNLSINRLKDKLGTRALPTAEIELNGVPATMIGEEGRGVKQIATLLNITRIYNAVSSVAYMRRAIALAKDYARKREAFGKHLAELPLHTRTLQEAESVFKGSFYLVFFVVSLLGKDECGVATKEESNLLRLLTPVVKLYTGKKSLAVISEMMESIGGVAYLEDSDFPRLLRDAQVFSIWEGTTNVLSLDVLRVLRKTDALDDWRQFIRSTPCEDSSRAVIHRKLEVLNDLITGDIERNARSLSYGIARLTIASLLLRYEDPISAAEWLDTDITRTAEI